MPVAKDRLEVEQCGAGVIRGRLIEARSDSLILRLGRSERLAVPADSVCRMMVLRLDEGATNAAVAAPVIAGLLYLLARELSRFGGLSEN